MGYYMRYISVDKREISMTELENALKQSDPLYSFTDVIAQPRESGTLTYNDDLYGVIEINRSGDGLFEEEIQEFKKSLEDAEGKGKKTDS